MLAWAVRAVGPITGGLQLAAQMLIFLTSIPRMWKRRSLTLDTSDMPSAVSSDRPYYTHHPYYYLLVYSSPSGYLPYRLGGGKGLQYTGYGYKIIVVCVV